MAEIVKLKCLSNEGIIKLLLRKDNVSRLEDLLTVESQKLLNLKSLENGGLLDFGEVLSFDNIMHVFYKVKEDVDICLGVKNVSIPSLRYKSGLDTLISILSFDFEAALKGTTYDPKKKLIRLLPEEWVNAVSSLAHEYAHHVQIMLHYRIFYPEEYSALREGHARGVERFISYKYRDKEMNESFVYSIVDETVGELKSVYAWLCDELRITPKSCFANVNTSLDSRENYSRRAFKTPTNQAIGNTFFCLEELKKGIDVYKCLVHGNFVLE